MWPFKKKCSLTGSGIFREFTDWHSHVLPGVDDGARTMDEALEILALYGGLGVETVWLTPHVMEDVPTTTGDLKERFEELKVAYKGTISLHLAAEYMLDNLFEERLKENDLLPLGEDADSLLVETSRFRPPMNLAERLERIKSRGFHPVLAHPERYNWLETEDYRKLRAENIRLQLNLFSLCGIYGPAVRKKASGLLQAGMYDLAGTDTHRPDMFRRMASARAVREADTRKLPSCKND